MQAKKWNNLRYKSHHGMTIIC
uniref:Uncharacterized protein n=1 Tax=Rhizophora mucronata TaxID=61149 RepID=A0A2P2QJS5_RHIMU